MYCPNCGTQQQDGARFCGNCGVELAVGQSDLDDVASDSAASAARPGAGDIPPRDLGQLVSATLALYRRAAVPLFIIALVPQLPNIINFQPDFGTSFALSLLSFLLAVVAGVAGIYCVCHELTGRSTDVLDCFGRAVNVLLPMLGVVIIVVLALLGSAVLMLIVIGIPLFFFLLVIWSLAAQAVVIENEGVFAALGRSRELVRGSWWRVFGIGVVFVLFVVAVVAAFFAASSLVELLLSPGPLASAIASGVISALLSPVLYIGSTLLYIDLRVRNEGYDLQALANDLTRRPTQARQ